MVPQNHVVELWLHLRVAGILQWDVHLINLRRFPSNFLLTIRSVVSVRRRLFTTMASTVRDPSTQSNYDQFRTKHTKTNFTIDFAKHRLTGEVRLKLDTLKAAKEIVLDTSFLDVHEVAVDEQPAQWVLDPRIESLGSALRVTLARDAEVGKAVEVAVRPSSALSARPEANGVQIKVSTTEHSTALQWLTPQQTSNKKHPYMCKVLRLYRSSNLPLTLSKSPSANQSTRAVSSHVRTPRTSRALSNSASTPRCPSSLAGRSPGPRMSSLAMAFSRGLDCTRFSKTCRSRATSLPLLAAMWRRWPSGLGAR